LLASGSRMKLDKIKKHAPSTACTYWYWIAPQHWKQWQPLLQFPSHCFAVTSPTKRLHGKVHSCSLLACTLRSYVHKRCSLLVHSKEQPFPVGQGQTLQSSFSRSTCAFHKKRSLWCSRGKWLPQSSLAELVVEDGLAGYCSLPAFPS